MQLKGKIDEGDVNENNDSTVERRACIELSYNGEHFDNPLLILAASGREKMALPCQI